MHEVMIPRMNAAIRYGTPGSFVKPMGIHVGRPRPIAIHKYHE